MLSVCITPGLYAGDSDGFLKDMQSDSDDEDHSFYGEAVDLEGSDDDEEAGQNEAVFSAQRAERAARNASSASAAAPESTARKVETVPAERTSLAAAAPAAKPSGTKGFAFRFPPAAKAKPVAREPSSQPTAKSGEQQQPQAASSRLSDKGSRHSLGPKEPPVSHVQQAHTAAEKGSAHDTEQWDALTETDSDDDFGQAGSLSFMSQYAAAMDAELGSSNIGNTFARPPQPSTNTNGMLPHQFYLHLASDVCPFHHPDGMYSALPVSHMVGALCWRLKRA